MTIQEQTQKDVEEVRADEAAEVLRVLTETYPGIQFTIEDLATQARYWQESSSDWRKQFPRP